MVNIFLDGELRLESMNVVLSVAKKTINRVVDYFIYHALIFPAGNGNVQVEPSKNNTTVCIIQPSGLLKFFVSTPNCIFLWLPSTGITVRGLGHVIEKDILSWLPDEIDIVEVPLEPEAFNGAYYNYSHGLKKHDGNCQRISHGHRSAIHIYVEEQHSLKMEGCWAVRWNSTYLVTAEDIVSVGQLSTAGGALWHSDLISSAYYGTHGSFELLTIKENTDILPGDTTVGSLVLYVHKKTRSHLPAVKLEVHAFEGIDKGAIATC
ncbi:Uncharacterised protein [Serratia liquefaciens]|nr:Uncharacterised protein [Serratia liquefaciens]